MKAVIHLQYGEPEVLQVTAIERPVPKKNEVLIRVKAAGLDYGQWHLMAGKSYVVGLSTELTRRKQRVLGKDVSGVVEAVGAEVTRFNVGDTVFGASSQTFAEFAGAREIGWPPSAGSTSRLNNYIGTPLAPSLLPGFLGCVLC